MSALILPGDRFRQVLPYGRDVLTVEAKLHDGRYAMRRASGARQVFPAETLLNERFWVRLR